ncbi:glycoside hydrolase [Chaetomidium leptoderma]|uniref:lytic cellulose monooxygenase (C4-dehydrogenating) n=1 Tax=Chaetomidium leptoderma TaxID=669021 RepID=A0AAN6VJW4_9PEZI|nr:glycoside hydrolase [Chaetomidium leptoderma]
MLLTFATIALVLASTASAHVTMHSVKINGQDQGEGQGKYIRKPRTNDPLKDLKSPAIVCNNGGDTPAPSFIKAAAGDKLSFKWYHYEDPNDILDPSHLGAILTYIAPYTEGSGTGPIWTKLAQEGLEGGQWATIKLIANNGYAEVALPKALASGKYLIRQEIIALHQADEPFNKNPVRGVELYPSCTQIEVTGSGKAVPDQDFDLNQGYTYDNPGLVVNIFFPEGAPYTPPGPKVWDGK